MANYTRPQYLMSKDIPVAKITGFYVEVLRQDLLPLAIRTPDVDFDRILAENKDVLKRLKQAENDE